MNKHERPQNIKGYGVGGWLIAVQVFLWIGLAASFGVSINEIVEGNTLNSVIFIILMINTIFTIVQFYRKRILFRSLLLCSMAVLLAYLILTLNWNTFKNNDYISLAIISGLFLFGIVMLFVSPRVKKTFCENGRKVIKQNKQEIVNYNIQLEKIKTANKKPRKNRMVILEMNSWIVLLQIHFISALCSQLIFNISTFGGERRLGILLAFLVVMVSFISAFYIWAFYRRRTISVYFAILAWSSVVCFSAVKTVFDETYIMVFLIWAIWALINAIRLQPEPNRTIYYWRVLH